MRGTGKRLVLIFRIRIYHNNYYKDFFSLIFMNERIEYVNGICIAHKLDIFTLGGINYDGIWYTGGKISTGKILQEIVWDIRDVKFNFGDLGKFSFPNSTVREVRRRGLIEKYEKENGKGSGGYIEGLIGMSWERIWDVVWKNNHRLEKSYI